MTVIKQIRQEARTLFLEGVRAADPAGAVKSALARAPLGDDIQGHLYLIAFGKAACTMMQEALHHVPKGQAHSALAITNYENLQDIDGCKVFAAGHPLPDQNGLAAGAAVLRLLEGTQDGDQVLCLISGGGSALMPTPRDGLTLADKVAVSEVLLSRGLSIAQMNAVRQQLSVLKGGGLLEQAHPATVRSLIVSDVVGDDIDVIASGPTAPFVDRSRETVTFLKGEGIWNDLPEPARRLLVTPKRGLSMTADNQIICSNLQSLQAIAAAAPEWSPVIVTDALQGDVADAARSIVDTAMADTSSGKRLLIWGGETTVSLTGTGQGGRNQEMSGRVAQLAQGLPGNWVFLSGGTDGRDGPTDAAGGIVDAGTLANIANAGVNFSAALANNDSYHILKAANNLLQVGATGTNVADIQMLFRWAD